MNESTAMKLVSHLPIFINVLFLNSKIFLRSVYKPTLMILVLFYFFNMYKNWGIKPQYRILWLDIFWVLIIISSIFMTVSIIMSIYVLFMRKDERIDEDLIFKIFNYKNTSK